jgi:hypothetical protein
MKKWFVVQITHLIQRLVEKSFEPGKGLLERGNNPLLYVEMCVLLLLSALGEIL